MLGRSIGHHGGDRCCDQQEQNVGWQHMPWHAHSWQASTQMDSAENDALVFAPAATMMLCYRAAQHLHLFLCRDDAPAPASYSVPALHLSSVKAGSARHALQTSGKENSLSTSTGGGGRVSADRMVDLLQRWTPSPRLLVPCVYIGLAKAKLGLAMSIL